jgi:FtsZ-interacting cell division protein ZipA
VRTLCKALILACALAVLTGCGVTGQWKMESIKPENAKEHFQMHWMNLADDGSYKACVKEGDKCKELTGTYKYDADTKTLTFKTDGKERAYHAEVCPLGGMKITGGEKGKEWTAVMKHGPCCDKGTCKATCEKKEEPKKTEAKKEEPKKAEPKKEAPKKEEAKKPEAKKEAPKKEEPKKEPGTPG